MLWHVGSGRSDNCYGGRERVYNRDLYPLKRRRFDVVFKKKIKFNQTGQFGGNQPVRPIHRLDRRFVRFIDWTVGSSDPIQFLKPWY